MALSSNSRSESHTFSTSPIAYLQQLLASDAKYVQVFLYLLYVIAIIVFILTNVYKYYLSRTR